MRTVAKVGVPARLEDITRSASVWPLAIVPSALVNGAPSMLYSPPRTLIGALVMPEIVTVFEVTGVLGATSTASTKLNGAGSADSRSSGTSELKRTWPKIGRAHV